MSAILYGTVISLYLFCCHSVLNSQKNYSAWKKWFLLGYASILFSLSTIAVVEDIRSFLFLMACQTGNGIFDFIPSYVVLPLGIWAADIFMMWHCVVLYRGTSHILQIILYSAIVLLLLASIVSGSFLLATNLAQIQIESLLALISISFIINISLSIMISVQICQHQRNIMEVLGSSHGVLYTHIIILFVESCGLIAAWNLVCLIFIAGSISGFEIPLALLPHILTWFTLKD
ncbi:hypothetical protein CPB84DRAFT_1750425 [Gymnopilus junonius]|uniref:Uncharacterized protein n=1 Tax=Gymnopilus junonius TaxID=109634 RepID=A0A9P5TID3_GYMJU|nr:hypothetical protein CPB84DRAFT_1750425 [Gymnopilus junonius]